MYPLRCYLSISIFRRLSLFPTKSTKTNSRNSYLSISIFRRLSLFLRRRRRCTSVKRCLSISIFRRLSLFPYHTKDRLVEKTFFFQSPFSGDFLCFEILVGKGMDSRKPFNLHFQETFFVSKEKFENALNTINSFQSPFSGDFLCFGRWNEVCD